MKTGMVVLTIICFSLICNFPCNAEGRAEEGNYEVHEWGVLVGCDDTSEYFMTSRPMKLVMVREPVLYVHSNDKKPFSLRVVFKKGSPTDTYPPAQVSGNTITWDNVTFSPSKQRNALMTQFQKYEPLEKIIPTLNDVDADLLYYMGHASRFLFYEGNIPYENRITSEYDFEKGKATVRNNADYPIYDVVVVAPRRGKHIFAPDIYVSRIGKILPGEMVTADFCVLKADAGFAKNLVDLGFTEKEALAFDNLWERPFFSPANTTGWSHLIYRLPEKEYNKLIELEFDPGPVKCIRAMYVVVRSFPEKKKPQSKRDNKSSQPSPTL